MSALKLAVIIKNKQTMKKNHRWLVTSDFKMDIITLCCATLVDSPSYCENATENTLK